MCCGMSSATRSMPIKPAQHFCWKPGSGGSLRARTSWHSVGTHDSLAYPTLPKSVPYTHPSTAVHRESASSRWWGLISSFFLLTPESCHSTWDRRFALRTHKSPGESRPPDFKGILRLQMVPDSSRSAHHPTARPSPTPSPLKYSLQERKIRKLYNINSHPPGRSGSVVSLYLKN